QGRQRRQRRADPRPHRRVAARRRRVRRAAGARRPAGARPDRAGSHPGRATRGPAAEGARSRDRDTIRLAAPRGTGCPLRTDRYGRGDYDGVCRAEPALDLGHFLAYLRFAMVKAAGADAPRFAPLEDALEAVFLDGYRSAGGVADRAVEERVHAYEIVSLLRLAVHAWQKMKPQRLRNILAALDARCAV